MSVQDLRDSPRARESSFFHKRGWEKRFSWEALFRRKPAGFRATICFGGEDEQRVQFSIGFLWFHLYLTLHRFLPKSLAVGWYERDGIKNPMWHEDSHGRSYGFYYFENALVFLWNASNSSGGNDRRKYGIHKFFYMPWHYGHTVAWEVQRADHTFAPIDHQYGRKDDEPYTDGRKIYVEPYKYILKNGTVQERIATFHVDRMEWRWRIFRKLRIGPKIVRQSINISFNDEVGERTGSWKGGCIGCSYEMLRGETPVETLRRMELEREF